MCLVPFFSGYWNNGANAGVFYRNFNNNRSNDNNNAGFRAADCGSLPDSPNGQTGAIGVLVSCTVANSAGLCIPVIER